jgi:hypothetical protein
MFIDFQLARIDMSSQDSDISAVRLLAAVSTLSDKRSRDYANHLLPIVGRDSRIPSFKLGGV